MELQTGKTYLTRTGEMLKYHGLTDDRTEAIFQLINKDGTGSSYFLKGPALHLDAFARETQLREIEIVQSTKVPPPGDSL